MPICIQVWPRSLNLTFFLNFQVHSSITIITWVGKEFLPALVHLQLLKSSDYKRIVEKESIFLLLAFNSLSLTVLSKSFYYFIARYFFPAKIVLISICHPLSLIRILSESKAVLPLELSVVVDMLCLCCPVW